MSNIEIKTTPAVPDSEFSPVFAQRMCDAMGLSFFKYGKASDAYPSKVDALASARERLSLYEKGGYLKGQQVEPGNIWYLVDAANFLMLESMHPRLSNAAWGRNESTDSPGRYFNGHLSEQDNHGRSQSDKASDDAVALIERRLSPSPSCYKRSGD